MYEKALLPAVYFHCEMNLLLLPATAQPAAHPHGDPPAAILKSDKSDDLNLTEAWKDNVVLDYAGIAGARLTSAQRTQLLDLVSQYVGNMDDGHARAKLDEVKARCPTWRPPALSLRRTATSPPDRPGRSS